MYERETYLKIRKKLEESLGFEKETGLESLHFSP